MTILILICTTWLFMNKSIVLLMRFEDYLTSSTTVIIEKRRSPWNCNKFLKSIVLLHDYCMFIIFKSIIFYMNAVCTWYFVVWHFYDVVWFTFNWERIKIYVIHLLNGVCSYIYLLSLNLTLFIYLSCSEQLDSVKSGTIYVNW